MLERRRRRTSVVARPTACVRAEEAEDGARAGRRQQKESAKTKSESDRGSST